MTKFKLSYSVDGGTTYLPITTGYVTGTSKNWTIPLVSGSKKNCLVRVQGFNNANTKLGADTSDGPFTIKVEAVKVTVPNGGEICAVQIVCPITWKRNATIAPPATANLSWSENGGTTWKLIATVSGTDTSYNNWKPKWFTGNKLARVKVTLFDASGNTIGSDTSDADFYNLRQSHYNRWC